MKPVNAPKDFLTSCYSRDGILPFLKKMEEEYLTSKKPFSILIMDVDHFKSFNDKYGHLMGDEVLKYFSSSMRLDLEDEENAPFRFGGDEFVMVFPHKTPMEAYHLANRLRKNIRTRSCLIKGKQITITFSGGIAGYPTDANSIEEILDKADKALYYSKNHGRSRITQFTDLGRKELLQIIAMLLALAVIGSGLYFFRDSLSTKLASSEIWLKNAGFFPVKTPAPPVAPPVVPPSGVVTGPDPSLPTPAPVPGPTPVTPNPGASEPEKSSIFLDSGRVVVGVIKGEDTDSLQVEITLNEGKGVLRIKKAQILRIESGGKTVRKFL